AENGHHRTDIDDLAATAAFEGRIGGFGAQKCAGEVGVYHRVPLGNRQVVRRLADIGAGIVDENVESTVMLDRLRDQRVDRAVWGTTAGAGGAPPPPRLEPGRGARVFPGVARRKDEGGPRRCQAPGHAEPNAPIAAGYDGDLSVQIKHAILPVSS